MIRYLRQEEFDRCLPLWQEAFPEDSGKFVQYYFGKKLKGGRVLVKEDGGGSILTMAHLNPYKVMVRERLYELSYIAGVATASRSRHQGHMRDVLTKMLGDMHQDHTPFCYLMPADPAIYSPFGFAYVFDQPVWELGGEGLLAKRVSLCLGQSGGQPFCGAAGQPSESAAADREYLVRWLNRWLKARFQVYAVRDREYLDMLQAELDSEDGEVWGLFDGEGKLEALQSFWGLHRREQRFLYCAREEWVCKRKPIHPGIMARITDVRAMAETVTVSEDCPCARLEVLIRVHDKLVPGNDGLWRWNLGRDGSKLVREQGRGFAGEQEPGDLDDTLRSTEVLDISIQGLASWLFGYTGSQKAPDEGELPFWRRYVRVLEGVFLDEIV